MSNPKVWRRVVYLKWKDTAPPGAVAMAFNIHKSFPRLIPSVLSVSEGMTFTSLADGGGAYPGVAAGEQNKGFHSAIEIILSCSTTAEMTTKYFEHPAHMAAAKIIDPLIEDAWAMDWLEDRDTLLVPSSAVSVMKHLVFFQFEEAATQAQRSALFAAWRALPDQLPHVLAVSCGEPIRWDRGDKRGFHAGLVVDLALSSSDGVQEICEYANSHAYQKINSTLLAPIRKNYVVIDFAEHRFGTGTGATSKL
eukprot:TRINITY_DN102087_c0_g1_i1.p1 TRINITY_DN102087_c0_g1~~TRINITY_DN102087_c0_g1_i1.p1  ORF type:complete len:275 (+),score=51.91 TRINITY_DN102087_c0_g1_i1:73-825(+)